MQELDRHWSIRYETVIRAKSNKGFKTRVWKVTQNKFQLEEERPELVDDWDQRLLMSILSWNVKANRLTLLQVAEKDQGKPSVISLHELRVFFCSVSARTARSSLRLMRRTLIY